MNEAVFSLAMVAGVLWLVNRVRYELRTNEFLTALRARMSGAPSSAIEAF